MATYSSILAWKISWTEEPGGLQSVGLQSWTRLSTAHSLSSESSLLSLGSQPPALTPLQAVTTSFSIITY